MYQNFRYTKYIGSSFSSKYKSHILYQNFHYAKYIGSIFSSKYKSYIWYQNFHYAKYIGSISSSKYKSHILYQNSVMQASNIAKFKFKSLSVTSYINSSQTAVTPKQTYVCHRQVFSHMVLCN